MHGPLKLNYNKKKKKKKKKKITPQNARAGINIYDFSIRLYFFFGPLRLGRVVFYELGRVVLIRDFTGQSCPGSSCLWAELS